MMVVTSMIAVVIGETIKLDIAPVSEIAVSNSTLTLAFLSALGAVSGAVIIDYMAACRAPAFELVSEAVKKVMDSSLKGRFFKLISLVSCDQSVRLTCAIQD